MGQDVVGIGNAGGTGGTPSYAGGTVTALNQSITASDEGDGTSEQLTGLIETNANIEAGDSGGSLVNDSGQVIGMDTAASAGFSFQGGDGSGNQGYAIPINTALTIAKQIEAGDASSTVHVGATGFLGRRDRWHLVQPGLERLAAAAQTPDPVRGRGGRGHHQLAGPRGRAGPG